MSSIPQSSVSIYTSASSIPSDVTNTLEAYPRTANVVLPMIKSSLRSEMRGEVIETPQYWIVSRSNSRIELILSLSNGALGTYPAFIVATVPSEEISEEFIVSRLRPMVECLLSHVPTSRIYSVFALKPIADAFSRLWTERTGIDILAEPYYDSWMSYCTSETFVQRELALDPTNPTFEIRPANMSDVKQVAELCFGFAAECPPFTLSPERALEEARYLITKNQLWVHRINESGASNIASLCALTRNTSRVAAITKVYTNPRFRKRGCAERLVARVCKHYFSPGPNKKESIVLYVGVDNPAAKVYSRVGFVGLTPASRAGAERWTEIGFDQSKVALGHW